MPGALNVDDIILNFDPAAPHVRFRAAGLDAAPTPAPLVPTPAETEDLSRFHGHDAVVVTWTSAEASALAALFTPGHPIATWYEYRHNVAADKNR